MLDVTLQTRKAERSYKENWEERREQSGKNRPERINVKARLGLACLDGGKGESEALVAPAIG